MVFCARHGASSISYTPVDLSRTDPEGRRMRRAFERCNANLEICSGVLQIVRQSCIPRQRRPGRFMPFVVMIIVLVDAKIMSKTRSRPKVTYRGVTWPIQQMECVLAYSRWEKIYLTCIDLWTTSTSGPYDQHLAHHRFPNAPWLLSRPVRTLSYHYITYFKYRVVCSRTHMSGRPGDCNVPSRQTREWHSQISFQVF